MNAKSEQERSERQRRNQWWLMVLGFVLLGALVTLAIWLSLTQPSENWPPVSLD